MNKNPCPHISCLYLVTRCFFPCFLLFFLCCTSEVRAGDTKPLLTITTDSELTQELWFTTFSHDGHALLTGGSDLALRIFDLTTCRMSRMLLVDDFFTDAGSLSHDETLAASGGDFATAGVLDVKSGTMMHLFKMAHRWCDGIFFLPGMNRLLVSSGDDGGRGTEIFSLTRGKPLIKWPKGFEWKQKREDSLKKRLKGWPGGLMALSQGEAMAALRDDTNHIKVVELTTYRTLLTLCVNAGAAAFSPDGSLLALGGEEKKDGSGFIKIWNLKNGRPLLTLLDNNHVDDLFFLEGGTRLLTICRADYDRQESVNTVKIVDLTTKKTISTYLLEQADPRCFVLSPDRKILAGGSHEGRVKLWDSATGKLLLTIMVIPVPTGKPAGHSIASKEWIIYSPEGYYDASPGARNYIKWNVGSELLPLEKYEQQFHKPELLRKILGT
jgi:WD40 repeat protein